VGLASDSWRSCRLQCAGSRRGCSDSCIVATGSNHRGDGAGRIGGGGGSWHDPADCLYRWGVLPARRRWIIATGLGAAVAWSLGMLPSALGGLRWTAGTVVAVGIGGLILLASLPLAQYLVLRDHVRRAVLWIPINMAAWLLGITWTLLPSPWIDQATPTAKLVVIYSIAGLCMAATVAVVTGIGILRLARAPIQIAGNGERSSSRSEHHAWSS
jgi:hypothetical protein